MSGAVSAGAGSADISTFTSNVVTFDASGSKDSEGDTLSYRWSIMSKPQGSNAVLGDAGMAVQTSIKADVSGTYVLNVRVTDSRGASADKQVTMLANTNAPVTTLSMTVAYSAVPTTLATREVTVGAAILVDASASVDADGDPVTTTFDLVERPAASRASLTIVGKTARFVADVNGVFKVRARALDPSGAYSETIYPVEALNNAPQTVITSNITNVTGNSGANTVSASVGYLVALSGAGSRDPDGDALTYSWSLVSRPAASTAVLTSATGAFSQLSPDQLGDYVVRMVATDPGGASSSYQTTVAVRNRRPEAVIGSNATPIALPNGPTLRLPVNTTLTLRGNASIDADGDALTYAWTLVSRPAASTATLSATGGTVAQLTTDAAGSYQVRLRVTDTAGAYSEKLLNIDSGNTAPTAMIDRSRISVLAGSAVTASAGQSYDDDGDRLTYTWAIDARPAGSGATIAAPNAARLSFTPDLPGTYVASVSVNDSKNTGMAYVTIKVLSNTTSNVPLSFVPLHARYSRGIDRFITVATNPNTLYIVDPFTGGIRPVPLPTSAKSLHLSGDGKLAVVLHQESVSLVDLEAATIIRSTAVAVHNDAFVNNAGLIYLVGRNVRLYNQPPVTIINGRTGVDQTGTNEFYGQGRFEGAQQGGVFAHSKNRGFVATGGVSPGDVSYFTVDPATGAMTGGVDSPYHGEYTMGPPFYLTETEDLLFMPSGIFFRTDTLQYAGRLSGSAIFSMSHSSSADEAIVLETTATPEGGYSNRWLLTYLPSYHRFRGALFVPDSDISLPLIDSKQSYAISIFHSANDNHVALVQTGSAVKDAPNIQYYLVTR